MSDAVWTIVGCAIAVVLIVAVVAWLFVRETRRIGRDIEGIFDGFSKALANAEAHLPTAVVARLATNPVTVQFDAATADRIAAIVQTEMAPTYDALRAAGDTLGRLMLGGPPNALIAQYEALVAAGEGLYARTGHSQDKRQRATWSAAVARWNPHQAPADNPG